jgi:putative spermidine/putrescine transport system permease protein
MMSTGWFARSVTALVVACMILPLMVVIATSFNTGSELAFPPRGFSFSWYENVFHRERILRSFEFSLCLALAATLGSLVLGLLSSVALVRYRFRGRDAIATLLSSPLMVPQVVLGMSLLILFSQIGIVSSLIGLGTLHMVLTLPYTVRVLTAALTRFPVSLEEAAVIHGARRVTAFALITVPCLKPGLVAAAIFAFVTSFDNFTASQFIVWDRTTLPIEIFAYAMIESDPTVCAISTMLILATIVVVVAAERWVGLETVTG